MKDIKITLATGASRASTIEAELKWLQEEGSLWYPVGSGKPRFAGPGSLVYFIRDGELVARGKVKSLKPGESRYDYSGGKQRTGGWEVEVIEMELATKRIPHKGFKGLRYVQPSDELAFNESFSPNV